MAAAIHELCLVLSALMKCDIFWRRLWGESIERAFELIDLGEVDSALDDITVAQLTHVFQSLGMSEDAAVAFVDTQVRAIRESFADIADLYARQPKDNRLLLDLKNRARDKVMFLRDSVCDPYREMMIRKQGHERARELLLRGGRVIWSSITGSLGSQQLALVSETGHDATFEAIRQDRELCELIKALSIVSFHLIDLDWNAPTPIQVPEPV